MKFLHVILAVLPFTYALYSSNSPVVKLTESNFSKDVTNSDEVWLVEFFAPWCGHCQKLAPDWEKAAKALKGIVKVGAVDMTTDQSVGAPYGIQGFPTIKLFSKGASPVDYNGGRSAREIAEWAVKQAEAVVKRRLGGGSSNSSGSSSSSGSAGGSSGDPDEKDVIVLTDSNFDETVLNSKDMWLVEFYAPWCGHCKNLKPDWAKAATLLKGQVKVAKVDATVETRLGSKYGIQGYPTIKIFPAGEKTGRVEDYNGPRDAESITRIALMKLDEYGIMPEVPQLTSKETLNEVCSKNVCVVAFLPHIYDSSAAERTRYIETLQNAAKKARGKPLSFFWAQGGDFYKFEEMMTLGFGYPAVVGISTSKSRYGVMRSAFTKEELDIFINKLLTGSVALIEYKELPKMKAVEAWDGKDASPELDEL